MRLIEPWPRYTGLTRGNSRMKAIRTRLLILLTCLPAMAAEHESRKDHKEYDFHYDIRYPGRLRSDVGRDKGSQLNPKDLKAYHRRVVECDI